MMLLALLSVGFAAGLVGSVLGLGGGLILVPALSLLFDVPIHHAIAASLAGAVATSCSAAPENLRRGFVNVRLSSLLEIFTIGGAIVGGLVGSSVDGSLLTRVFGLTLVTMSLLMFRKTSQTNILRSDQTSDFRGEYHDKAENRDVRYSPTRLKTGAGVSAGAGFLSGLLGIGGGIVQVPMLTLLNGLPMKAATSTSNYMLGATAVAGALVYYGQGLLQPVTTAGVVVGVLAGSRLGASLTRRVKSKSLRIVFAIVMIVVGLRMTFA